MSKNKTIKIADKFKDDENLYILNIPSLENSYIFMRNTYDSNLLSNIIEDKYYEKIILGASKKMGDTLLKKKTNDFFDFEKILMLISAITLVLFIIFAYSYESHKNSNFLFILTAIFLLSGIILTLFLCIYNFNKKNMLLGDIIEKDLHNYFKKINQQLDIQKIKGIKFEYDKNSRSIKCLIKKNYINNKKDIINNLNNDDDLI